MLESEQVLLQGKTRGNLNRSQDGHKNIYFTLCSLWDKFFHITDILSILYLRCYMSISIGKRKIVIFLLFKHLKPVIKHQRSDASYNNTMLCFALIWCSHVWHLCTAVFLWQGCQTHFHQGLHEHYSGPQRVSSMFHILV